LPHLQKIYDKYKDQGFNMVSVNTNESQAEQIPEWREENQFTFTILVGMSRDELREKYNHKGSPTNFLVNSDGKVFFKHLGYGPGGEKTMETEIREMLGLDPFAGIDFSEETTVTDRR
jgi:glutathione peroxidase-family protein